MYIYIRTNNYNINGLNRHFFRDLYKEYNVFKIKHIICRIKHQQI